MSEKTLLTPGECPNDLCPVYLATGKRSTDTRYLAKLDMLRCRRCGKLFSIPANDQGEGEASE
jgi:hypothetical protein